MKRIHQDSCAFLPCILALVSLITGQESHAQNIIQGPVGYVQVVCTGSSDSVASIPFSQAPAFQGAIASVSGSTVTVTGTQSWAPSQFVYSGSGSNTYFAILGAAASGTNPKEGCIYTVAANGTNSLTLSLNGDDISSVVAGSAVSVIPYWTLATVFPSSNELSVNPALGSFASSTSSRLSSLNTQILIPNYGGAGTNLSASRIYYYYNGAWRLFGDNPANYHGDDVLANNVYFIVRNSNTPNTTLTAMGAVPTGKVTIPLATEASLAQDNPVALSRPVDVALNDTGLAGSHAFTTSTSARLSNIADEVLVFSGTASAFNKSASSIYYYYQSHWALFGDTPSNDHGTDFIPAASGFVIRKAPTGNGATAFWQNSPTY